jgi:hypothetical protein
MVHKTVKEFKVDFNSIKSISDAQKVKTRLENNGYNLEKVQPVGFDKFLFVYSKR